eukprot:TCONS_00044770-protein
MPPNESLFSLIFCNLKFKSSKLLSPIIEISSIIRILKYLNFTLRFCIFELLSDLLITYVPFPYIGGLTLSARWFRQCLLLLYQLMQLQEQMVVCHNFDQALSRSFSTVQSKLLLRNFFQHLHHHLIEF